MNLKKRMIGDIKASWHEEGYEKYKTVNNVDDCVELVNWADTIIEADKEG